MNGTDFKAWRKRLSLTQAAAAEALGISVWAIKSWEGGRFAPQWPRMLELACRMIEGEAGVNDAGTT